MPHEKTRAAGRVVLDRRRALTLTPVIKLDSCRSGDPFKIHKRRVSAEDECADAEVSKSARKCNKIHWSHLASSDGSSQPNHHHNGQKAHHDQNDLAKLDFNGRQVKVLLTDVLQTEEGRRYLSSCGHDSRKKHPKESKRGTRERWSERRGPAEYRERRRTSPSRRDRILSPSSKGTGDDISPSKETRSPLPKRHRRFTNSLTQSESPSSNDKTSGLSDETVCLQSEKAHIPTPRWVESPDTEENELCPLGESDVTKSTSASSVHSEGSHITDDEQNKSKCSVPVVRRSSSSLTLSRLRKTIQHLESKVHSNKKSKKEMRESSEATGEEKGKSNQEKEEAAAVQQNGEVMEEGGGSRQSVLRLSVAVGEQPEKGLGDAEAPPNCSETQNSDPELKKVSKLQTPEPIVLSSEEEEEEKKNNSTSQLQTVEGAKNPQTLQRLSLAVERTKAPDPYTHTSETFMSPALSGSPEMELQFSALYIAGLSALSSGLMKITHDKILISLKDTEVKAFLPTAHVRKYSVWDGLLVQDSALVKQDETPPPSLLLLWLSEAQARCLSSDLSVIQPGTRPAEGSVCLLLCVSEPLKGIEGALLASIMDIVGLTHGNTELLTPLTHPESMKLLQSGRDTHLLQLLSPRTDTHTSTEETVTTPEPAATTTAPVTTTTSVSDTPDSEVQANSVYTLCHSRGQGSYSVSISTAPGTEWTPYKHCGPARRLIQFPPPPCKGAITVTTEDLECLDSGEFLNDVIIDFYLKYLLAQKAPPQSVKRSHIFSSFFYKQLTRRDNANEDSTSTPAQLRRHQRVRTWTRHVDIFEKDFLFVPVNQEAHWYLVVVCYPGMDEPQWVEREDQDSVQYGTDNSSDSIAGSETQEGSRHNSDGEKSSDENSSKSPPGPPNCTEKTCKRKTVCKRPCILIMDSLKLSVHERILKLLREYLQVEWEVKRGGQRNFSAERMVGSHCRVPLQDNSSDCGLYLLQYAESFLEDPVVHFDLPLRLECWFPRQQVREKREEIRDLVLHLYRFQQSSLGNEGSVDKAEPGNVVQ